MLRQKYQMVNFNWVLVSAVFLESILGVIFINSADSSYTARQLFGLVVSMCVMFALAFINYNYICDFTRILYVLNLIMLAMVNVAGVTVGGAKRWISLGFTRVQPSEISKVILILFVANYIQEHEEDFNDRKVLVRLVVLIAIPLVLIMTEPDLSTTLETVFIMLAIIVTGGLSGKIIRNTLLILIPLSVLFIWYIQTPNQILLEDYQVTRIMTFFDSENYSSTTAYQQDNSVMAIGSGQLYGKGLNNNTISEVTVSDTGLVSEQQTDFIFSVVGEETGFVGSMIVVGLLAVIVAECLKTAWWAKNTVGKLISVGMAAMIGFQSFINIGVATEILPNTGLPLPFLSYGLTSLLSCMMGIGLVLNIGLQRHY